MSRQRRDDARFAQQFTAGQLVDLVLSKHGVGEEIRERRVATEWHETVGERVASRTWPGSIRNGTLVLWVSNSSWMHQLSFVKDELIANINARFGDPPMVSDIRFNLGRPKREAELEIEQAQRTQSRSPSHKRALPAPATGPDLDRIQDESTGIEDDELRAIIIEARRRLAT